eukprot:645783-Hanusia_phi.AAC.1
MSMLSSVTCNSTGGTGHGCSGDGQSTGRHGSWGWSLRSEVYKDSGEDSRFGYLRSDVDEIVSLRDHVEGHFSSWETLMMRTITGPDNVSYIDEKVGMFTHEELAKYRCPGGGPIRRISAEEH